MGAAAGYNIVHFWGGFDPSLPSQSSLLANTTAWKATVPVDLYPYFAAPMQAVALNVSGGPSSSQLTATVLGLRTDPRFAEWSEVSSPLSFSFSWSTGGAPVVSSTPSAVVAAPSSRPATLTVTISDACGCYSLVKTAVVLGGSFASATTASLAFLMIVWLF